MAYRTKKADLSFGEQMEIANYPLICRECNRKMKKLPKYHTMDWVDEDDPDYYAEQKARTETLDEIKAKSKGENTLIIGLNKVEFLRGKGKGVLFFKCKDATYRIDYNKEHFDNFRIQEGYKRGYRKDCFNPEQAVVHIPMDLLTKCVEPSE